MQRKYIQFIINSLILFIFSFHNQSFAANWVGPKTDKPSFKFGVVATSLNQVFQSQNDKNISRIDYAPNSTGRLLVGVSYLGYGLTASLTSTPNEEEIAKKGLTKGEDFQFRFFNEQNTFDIFYQKYQGYYIQNSSEIDSQYGGNNAYFQRPDIHSLHYGLQYFRSLNPESLSMAACFEQNGWQKESGATWFLYSGLDFHHLDADSSFIPTQLSTQYLSIQDFQKGDFSTFKIGGGGAFALVFKSLFFASQLVLAGGQQKQVYTLSNNPVDKMIPTSGGNLKISLGYNGETFFTSFNIFDDFTSINLEDKAITLNTIESSVVFGTHF